LPFIVQNLKSQQKLNFFHYCLENNYKTLNSLFYEMILLFESWQQNLELFCDMVFAWKLEIKKKLKKCNFVVWKLIAKFYSFIYFYDANLGICINEQLILDKKIAHIKSML
jgi:hypothetical protein